MLELLTPVEMAQADRLTIEGGIPGPELMDRAGAAATALLRAEWPEARHILILMGPGNNGGDGAVIARLLTAEGLQVTAALFGDRAKVTGDARHALDAMMAAGLSVRPLTGDLPLDSYDLIVDALFGAGLARAIEGQAAKLIERINASGLPVLSIDLPSGIEGAGGRVMGVALQASATVTFFRRKPGHLLYPGRGYCGTVHLTQIGITAEVLAPIFGDDAAPAYANEPDLWRHAYPWPDAMSHKYSRGHLVCLSGPAHATGAARLMAVAALRAGAGAVTLASTGSAILVNASHLTEVMLARADTPGEFSALLNDARVSAVALGPGLPPDKTARDFVAGALDAGKATVIDGGGLSCFEETPTALFEKTKGCTATVLTPHEGEFARLFPDLGTDLSKLERAREAAQRSGATVVLKGADTVIAAPDGRAAINANAPPWLATAGSGDVLAGAIAGLLAQGMPAFQAACAGVWLHGEAGTIAGPGLIAGDIGEALRRAIAALAGQRMP